MVMCDLTRDCWHSLVPCSVYACDLCSPQQDACKVVTYIIMRKYDIFQINSANLVNVRGAQTFNENPLARQSAGAVEVSPGQVTALTLFCFPSSQQLPCAHCIACCLHEVVYRKLLCVVSSAAFVPASNTCSSCLCEGWFVPRPHCPAHPHPHSLHHPHRASWLR